MSENIRYFFPTGCKGIDVLIDNSSRLRTQADPYIHIRLPVTMKPVIELADEVESPSNGYILPGPMNIYAPNQLQTAATKPPTHYLPPTTSTTVPPNIYLPPEEPTNPPSTYLPPVQPEVATEIIPPEAPEDSCESSKCCDESLTGQFMIPIALKSSGCCQLYAKLILPITGFDEDSIRKLTSAFTSKIDGNELFTSILTNLVK